MSEINTQSPNENPEFWKAKTGEFLAITDDLLRLRDQEAERVFLENGLDYDSALEGFDVASDDQVTESSQIYFDLIEDLMGEESEVATRMTKINPQQYHIWITKPGGFVESAEVEEDGQTIVEYRGYTVENDGIYRTLLKTPPGKWTEETEAMMEEGVEQGAFEKAHLTQNEAQDFIRYLKTIRKYVGRYVYGEPAPEL